jgi:hypothetical protein
MSEKLKTAALVAFRLALRPLVRVLLRNGITYRTAAEVCKETFVEVAAKDYGVYGRPTNASRISILTGIGRHDVKKISDKISAAEPAEFERMNSATRVLGGWHNDTEFCDANWQPTGLTFDGDAKSFTGLCRRYAPGIPPTAMLKELLRVGGVADIGEGVYIAKMRYYMPDILDPDAVLRSGSVMEDLGNTVAYNLARPADSDEATRFEGRASSLTVRASAEKEFRQYLEAEAQGLLERTDLWLSQHEESSASKRSERTLRLGVGVYQIQDDEKND